MKKQKVDKKKNTFRVKTFDTMDETDLFINQLSGDDKSRLVEMETATEEKILHYLQEQEDSIKKAILQKEHELGQLRGLADQYFKKIKILRKELSLKSEYSILPKT